MDVLDRLQVFEPARHTVLVGELHGDQRAHDVVGRVLAAGDRVRQEVVAQFFGCFVERAPITDILVFVDVQLSVGELADVLQVGVRRSEHGGDHHARNARAEVFDEVEPSRADLLVEEPSREAPDALLDPRHGSRGEGAAEEVTVHGVGGWVLRDH